MKVKLYRAAIAATVLVAAACGAQGERGKDVATTVNRQADSLRLRVLERASFAGLADACSAGELRVFESDSGSAMPLLQEMERLIISHGAGSEIDNPDGLRLMTAVALLETHGPGIAWDVLDGPGPRTFNAITTVRLPNPETGECQDIPGLDPMALLMPPLTGWEVPRDSMSKPVMVGYGPDALNELRNFYFERHGHEPDSSLRYVRVTGVTVVGNYATVAVQRESERQGTTPVPQFRSGASYVLHKVGEEWRLLGYSRVW